MGLLARVLMCFLMFGLSNCTIHTNSQKAQEVAQCSRTCVQNLEICKKKCVDNCPNCTLKANLSAVRHYAQYVNEKKIEGELITRELKSYRDPLQCRKITCNCAADFNVCTQNCTGVIQKQLRIVPKCT